MENLVLYDTLKSEIKKYPRYDDKPVEQLDPRYVVLRVVREPAPELASNQRANETRTVDLEAMEWRWGWSVEDIPEPEPPADWGAFKRALLSHSEINSLLYGGMSVAPAAALSLPATLLAASGGSDVDDFRGAWLNLRRLGLVSTELLQELRDLAITLHLPAAFVEALGGGARPDPQYLGQEWVDSDGAMWVVVQGDAEGASLIWEKV